MDRKHALDGEPPLPPRHRRRLRAGSTSLGLTISTEFPVEAPSASTTLPNTGTASLSVSLPAHLNPFLPAPSPMSVPVLSASLSFTSDNGTPMADESCGTPRDQMLPSSAASSSRGSGGRPSLPSVSGPVRLTRRPSLAQTLMGRSQSRRGRGAGARMGGGSSSSSSSAASASSSSSSSSNSLAQLGSAVNRYHTDFEELKLIDSGSFGIVTKVRKRFDGCRYAVKRTRCPMGGKPVGGGRVALTDVLKEVFALAALDVCPFVVRYFNAWIEEGYGYIQMELCDYSLNKLMEKPQVTMETIIHVARDAARGISHLHRQNLVHLDIKPSNIFAKKGRDGATVYKIGDMGLACVATAVQGVQIEEGDVRYLAPEIFAGEHDALPKADVFSLGASLLALTIQRDLEGNGVEWHNLRSTEFDVKSMLPDHCTTPFAELLCKLMNPVVSSRPTIEQVLANDLLRSESELWLEHERAKNAQLLTRLEEAEKKLRAKTGAVISSPSPLKSPLKTSSPRHSPRNSPGQPLGDLLSHGGKLVRSNTF